MSDTRRDAIEAAFEQAEEPSTTSVEAPPEPIVEAEPTVEVEQTETTEPTGEAPTEELTEEAPVTKDKPPQSWKPTEATNWAKVDAITKSAIQRRELEISRTLTETGDARKLATGFTNVVQPFMARIQSMNVHPLQAVQELFKADHILSTGTKDQRAQMVAKLVSDYGVDIEALDNALSGRAQPPAAPTQALTLDDVERLVSARLSTQQNDQQINSALSEFSDKAKYPYFEQVREDMADLIELSAKKGKSITLQAAYNKAVQLDSTISQELVAQTKAANALAINAAAQKAKKASLQVGGAPSGNLMKSPAGMLSRRDAIEAAFEASSGR